MSLASGQYTGPDRDANGNIVPTPKGEKCVEPTADMRANHMQYLLHKRDKTMYQGIRSKQHSLVECINCHATPANDGKIARVSESKHFCASCHLSVSVKLDCFECHADRPVSAFSQLPARDFIALQSETDLAKPQVAMHREVQ
ncbi:MAG: Hdr-like menaquinol oxidoreductase cytochrome c subunit [Gammaproteobacteria bacterium]|nr:Hdr-like menaquinol oxidoreductase cytochrome c subunit [Gammaproteobacteria bacterium]